MANWFKTKKEANKELKKRQKEKTWYCSDEVWKWPKTAPWGSLWTAADNGQNIN